MWLSCLALFCVGLSGIQGLAEWNWLQHGEIVVPYIHLTSSIVMAAPQAVLERGTQGPVCLPNPLTPSTNEYILPITVLFWSHKQLDGVAELLATSNRNITTVLPLRVHAFRLVFLDPPIINNTLRLTNNWIPNDGTTFLPKRFTFFITGGSVPFTNTSCQQAAEQLINTETGRPTLINTFMLEMRLTDEFETARSLEEVIAPLPVRSVTRRDLTSISLTKPFEDFATDFILSKEIVEEWAERALDRVLQGSFISNLKHQIVSEHIADQLCREKTSVWQYIQSVGMKSMSDPRLVEAVRSHIFPQMQIEELKAYFEGMDATTKDFCVVNWHKLANFQVAFKIDERDEIYRVALRNSPIEMQK